MRRAVTVPAAQVAERRTAGKVAVFDKLPRRVRPTRAQIDGQHGLDAGRAAPVDEFVGAEAVGLDAVPGKVETNGPLLERPYAILPIVARYEIAPGVAHNSRTELAHQCEYVAAKTTLVRGWMAGLENSPVDATSHVLDESAEQPAVGGADRKIAIQYDLSLQHGQR